MILSRHVRRGGILPPQIDPHSSRRWSARLHNATDLLDAATARRFLFKVRFMPMTAQAARPSLIVARSGWTAPSSSFGSKSDACGFSGLICRKVEVFGACVYSLGKWLRRRGDAPTQQRTLG